MSHPPCVKAVLQEEDGASVRLVAAVVHHLLALSALSVLNLPLPVVAMRPLPVAVRADGPIQRGRHPQPAPVATFPLPVVAMLLQPLRVMVSASRGRLHKHQLVASGCLASSVVSSKC
jgi:hypothetical protein